MKRALGLFCAAALVMTGACGKFGSGKAAPTTLLGGVGAHLSVPTTNTLPPTTARPAATTAPAPKCPYTNPTSNTTFDNRLKLELTATPLCPQHANDIALTLKVTNVSSQVVHYDKNQSQFFSLLAYPQGSGRIRWEDTNCQPASGDGTTPAGDLAPGATITFGDLYPAPTSVSDREKCRRLEPGGYAANAVFLVCDTSYQDGYCDITKDTQVKAEPVLLNLES